MLRGIQARLGRLRSRLRITAYRLIYGAFLRVGWRKRSERSEKMHDHFAELQATL